MKFRIKKKGHFCSESREIQVSIQIVIVDRIWVIWFLNLAEIGETFRIL